MLQARAEHAGVNRVFAFAAVIDGIEIPVREFFHRRSHQRTGLPNREPSRGPGPAPRIRRLNVHHPSIHRGIHHVRDQVLRRRNRLLGDKIVALSLAQARALSEYLKEVHGLEAAAGGVMMAAAPAAAAAAPARKRRTEIRRCPFRSRRQQDRRHQGRPRDHGPRAEGSQGPRRRRSQDREGGRGQGRCRDLQEEAGRSRSQGRPEVRVPSSKHTSKALARRGATHKAFRFLVMPAAGTDAVGFAALFDSHEGEAVDDRNAETSRKASIRWRFPSSSSAGRILQQVPADRDLAERKGPTRDSKRCSRDVSDLGRQGELRAGLRRLLPGGAQVLASRSARNAA